MQYTVQYIYLMHANTFNKPLVSCVMSALYIILQKISFPSPFFFSFNLTTIIPLLFFCHTRNPIIDETFQRRHWTLCCLLPHDILPDFMPVQCRIPWDYERDRKIYCSYEETARLFTVVRWKPANCDTLISASVSTTLLEYKFRLEVTEVFSVKNEMFFYCIVL